MAKQKSKKETNKNLSMAEIICAISLVILWGLLLLGLPYVGISPFWSLLRILGLFLSLIAAVYLKKSKPYNQTVWRCAEYGCVAVYVGLACFFTVKPIGTFLNRELVKQNNIIEALDDDSNRVNTLLNHFASLHSENLRHTCDGMKLICDNRGAGVDISAMEFIKTECGVNDVNSLNTAHIDAYKEKEEKAIRDKKSEVEENFNDTVEAYKNWKNLFRRPYHASKIIEQYSVVANLNQKFVEEHSYPSFDATQRYATKEQETDLQYELGGSKFEKALQEVTWFNFLTFLILLILHFFIIVPYLAGVRQDLIRSVDKSGKDIGGRLLIVHEK